MWAADEREQQPLRLALSAPLFAGGASAVAFVCRAAGASRGVVADSADWPDGLATFDDWAAALQGGCSACQAVTAPFISGASVLGFVTLLFGDRPALSALQREALCDFCEPVADALLACRVRAAAMLGRASAEFGYPPHLVSRLHSSVAAADVGVAAEAMSSDHAVSSSEPDEEKPAESYADVTVLLANVVGWTTIAASLPPPRRARGAGVGTPGPCCSLVSLFVSFYAAPCGCLTGCGAASTRSPPPTACIRLTLWVTRGWLWAACCPAGGTTRAPACCSRSTCMPRPSWWSCPATRPCACASAWPAGR